MGKGSKKSGGKKKSSKRQQSAAARSRSSSPTPPEAAQLAAAAASEALDRLDLEREADVVSFVAQVHKIVEARRHERQSVALRAALEESRDAVLRRARRRDDDEDDVAAQLQQEGRGGRKFATRACTDAESSRQRVFPRLPSNASDPPAALAELYCLPCSEGASADNVQTQQQQQSKKRSGSKEAKKQSSSGAKDTSAPSASSVAAAAQDASAEPIANDRDGIVIKIRTQATRAWFPQVASPPLYLEGTHPPRPPSTATVFLRQHYAIEDESTLQYVPYFGDDDKEDVVSELFDINHRAKLMEFGPEYEERDMNDEVDETLIELIERAGDRLLVKDLGQNKGVASVGSSASGATDKKKKGKAKKKADNDDGQGTSFDRHDETIVHQMTEALSDVMDLDVDRINERYKLLGKRGSAVAAAGAEDDDDSIDEKKQGAAQNSEPSVATSYEEVMDSYRNLFCRRCFIYDCNVHGNISKPSIELQGELAVQREKEGFWEKEELLPADVVALVAKSSPPSKSASKSQPSSTSSRRGKRTRESELDHDVGDNEIDDADLTPVQESICERMFMIFQGNIGKMAKAMGANRDAVERCVREKNMKLKEPTLLVDGMTTTKKRRTRDGTSEYTSMKNYNVAWLKNVQDAEIHPAFIPCDHEGPCNEETCSCVQNAFFCTKHCVWGERSRNFFRGCACKGPCNTKSCACFAAKRECDPDLCRTCGACTDPPQQRVTNQRCTNDNLSMRRHAHLLVAESSIPDAGWGLFTKHALKRGDFVHEYVGEIISQEEAERRGRIYDKVNRSYLFNLSSDYVVDASRKGNKTKYANHSSKPNCFTKMVTVNGDSRIGLFAKCDIEAQSELFFDYRYDVGMENELIVKPGQTVAWMNDPEMAGKISKISGVKQTTGAGSSGGGSGGGGKKKGSKKKHA